MICDLPVDTYTASTLDRRAAEAMWYTRRAHV